jgi:glycosyltransferase involved in cell wall biosynthesis
VKRRLLNITMTPPVRTEHYIWTQLRALSGSGWEIRVAHGVDAISSDETPDAAGCASVVPLVPLTKPVTPLGRLGKVIRTGLRRNSEQAHESELALWRDLIRREDPDIVLVQFGPTAARLLPVLAACGKPWVVQFHGYDVTQRCGHWGYRLALRSVLKAASSALGCSEFVAGELRRWGGRSVASKLHVVSPGYDEGVYDRGGRSEGPSTPPHAISVARLVEGKGHHLAIEAVARTRTPITLTIIGEGPMRPQLTDLIAARGLQDRVRLEGQRSPGEIVHAMRRSDLFVQLSTTAQTGWREGLGLSPIEAAATGLPTVVSDSGGLAETCLHGRTGLVVGDRDVNGCARAFDDIAADPSRAAAMGEAGAQWVASKYASKVQAARADAIFNALL